MSIFSPRLPLFPKDALQAARDYERRIGELLESCADHQRHDPEVFLWNARRALEAVCHLLLTVQRQRPSRVEKATNDASLDGMIRQLKTDNVLDREQAPRFDLARSHTNLGVHIQKPEREDYATAVADTAHVLPGLLDWLYDESIARPHLQKKPSELITLIREGGREGPSLKDAATVARTEAHAKELTARMLRGELDEKEKALRNRETRWWRWLGRLAFVAVFAFASGFGVGRFGMEFDAGAILEVLRGVAPASAVEASVQSAAAPRVAAQPTPPAPTCPAGMLKIAARELRLGQPVGGRRNWPRPTVVDLPKVEVAAFCLDPAPRRPSAEDVTPIGKCKRTDSDALTCLTRDEAEAVCRSAGGALPTLLQWEAAARASPPELVLPIHEWAGERFPPRALSLVDPSWPDGDGMWVGPLPKQRAPTNPEGAVLLAWNQQSPTNRSPVRSFRCAASLQ